MLQGIITVQFVLLFFFGCPFYSNTLTIHLVIAFSFHLTMLPSLKQGDSCNPVYVHGLWHHHLKVCPFATLFLLSWVTLIAFIDLLWWFRVIAAHYLCMRGVTFIIYCRDRVIFVCWPHIVNAVCSRYSYITWVTTETPQIFLHLDRTNLSSHL